MIAKAMENIFWKELEAKRMNNTVCEILAFSVDLENDFREMYNEWEARRAMSTGRNPYFIPSDCVVSSVSHDQEMDRVRIHCKRKVEWKRK